MTMIPESERTKPDHLDRTADEPRHRVSVHSGEPSSFSPLPPFVLRALVAQYRLSSNDKATTRRKEQTIQSENANSSLLSASHEQALHSVVLRKITHLTRTVRQFRLEITNPNGIKFLPGQWLDVYVPGVPQAGGFTITSPPSKAVDYSYWDSIAQLDKHGFPPSPPTQLTQTQKPPFLYLELAVQKSPQNPAAAWLWQDERKILNKVLEVRVGGSFVVPPYPKLQPLDKVIFIAGGVGVNPFMSMLSAIAESYKGTSSTKPKNLQVHFLYSVRESFDGVLFLSRIAHLLGYGIICDNPTDELSRVVDEPNPGRILDGKLTLFRTPSQDPAYHARVERMRECRERQEARGRLAAEKEAERKAWWANQMSKEYNPLWEPLPPSWLEKLNRPAAQNSPPRRKYPVFRRRIAKEDVAAAIGDDKDSSAVYICGPPPMTDYFVELLTGSEESGGLGMDKGRVLFEKWW